MTETAVAAHRALPARAKERSIPARVVEASLLGLGGGLASTVFFGFAAGVVTLFTILWGAVLMHTTRRFIARRETMRVAAELYVPGLMWWLFGVGAIVAIVGVDGLPRWTPYDDVTVGALTCYAAAGSLAYVLAFRLVFRNTRVPVARSGGASWAMGVMLVAMLPFDWYMRLRLIRQGLYFNQLTHFQIVLGAQKEGWLNQVFAIVGFLVFAFAAYFAVRAETRLVRFLARSLLVLQFGGIL